ncbi:Transcriptional regulatory protein [Mesorhizobium prunaredense]|uniref:Transcriptional regulatory protein n=1 Tax=Mesorhizobium prunaredense TaxID=1631249 RepID=A0A1R3VAE8_9HYPH|nr:MucR family transcriptional regulator [Mesorhizobium prunaredense]SIT56890.1 Transcriptional regulatory protein [Mesorhizobium prunaredense]
MTEEADRRAAELAELTADVVAAFVSNNSVPVAGLPDLIASVHSSLSNLSQPTIVEQRPLVPAVNPKKSVTPDFITCLEDGKKFKSLKRHLATHHGMTPAEFRSKWDLPGDYLMTAPNYAAQRSELAKSIGLGRKAAAPVEKVPAKFPRWRWNKWSGSHCPG